MAQLRGQQLQRFALPIGWSLAFTYTDDYDGDALPNNITGITKANPGVVSSVAHTLVVW